MSQKFALLESLESLLPLAFGEDMPDITAEATCHPGDNIVARIVAKQPGVICGLPLLPYIFTYRMASISVAPQAKDGEVVQTDQAIAVVEGSGTGILSAERVALNFLQHLSGIATLTRKFVTTMQAQNVTLLDTRKTTPGWRLLEKYAVRVGGGKNHRMGAYDEYLIKENHVRVSGGIDKAIQAVKDHRGSNKKPLVVEVTNMEELKLALTMGVDRIMLDNFDLETMKQAVSLTRGKVPLEVSGGVNLQTVRAIASTGIQFISVGALTHSAPILDLSLQVSTLEFMQKNSGK
ncbi:MAG TPA: carboxylating nicotinate-nucleotide diphosphorylase [Thermoanaerobaculia bacterium]|nr:carboxylating nicotinate-nucleotide diphosphorylase [Thermoanaerobaculia bacterium]HUM30764.1 carboxylating nicotinate-nucleotide diphosphorylase [Thermoanaerobaculia bacterium]HXK69036.1 carboxylating nicotinate-nucleotide diphosphorylase [Thermoanaerobaculia bacterium]